MDWGGGGGVAQVPMVLWAQVPMVLFGLQLRQHVLHILPAPTLAIPPFLLNNTSLILIDNSIAAAKTKSSPGADGISNDFIKESWQIFRILLFRLAAKCYEENKLTDPFRSAEIKLIPKKVTFMLKNWRPISLLNCFYKIISRAISSRLKKFMDKLTPVCQKGYCYIP